MWSRQAGLGSLGFKGLHRGLVHLCPRLQAYSDISAAAQLVT